MAKLKLHPVHMMIVHFPVALFCVDLIFFGVASVLENHDLMTAAYYVLIAGVISGWIAILTGLVDIFIHVPQNNPIAVKKAWLHASVQSLVVATYTILLSIEYKDPEVVNSPSAWVVVTKSLLICFLLFGNFLGGDMVLRYVSKHFQAE